MKPERIVLRGPFLQPEQVARSQGLSKAIRQRIDAKVAELFGTSGILKRKTARKAAPSPRRAKVPAR
jgi:hypothetical protein